MKYNIVINESNVITSWTRIPFSYENPIIELTDDQIIRPGYSTALNPHEVSETRIAKKKILDKNTHKRVTVNETVSKTYTVYDFYQNEEAYQAARLERIQAAKPKRYETLVEQYIRERYTVSQELAILRQKDTKTEEYNEYFTYAEECKAKARAEVLEAKGA